MVCTSRFRHFFLVELLRGDGGGRKGLVGFAWQAVHPLAPSFVVVTHPDFVVDRLVFVAAVKNVARLRPRTHRGALPGDTDQVFMQVAPEGSPDRVVVVDARHALFRRVSLEAKPAEFDHDLIGSKRGHDIATKRRAAQVEVETWEQVDHVPLVWRQAGER